MQLIEGGEPVVIPNQEGSLTTPSVVAFQRQGKEDQVLVGAMAKRQAAMNPSETFYSIKRFIGKAMDDCKDDAERVAFSVCSDPEGLGQAVMKSSHSDVGFLYPEEISSYVLAKLIAAAEDFTGRPVEKAVISIPAYFNDEQREATITAGRIAGLSVVKTIREPVAAALAYGISTEEDKTVLVFDLGGGTFDVSMLEVGGGVIEVLSTGGDPHLGGDDWDAAIMDWLIDSELKPRRIDYTNPTITTNLRAIAEAAKIKLSTEEKVIIRMPVGGGIETILTRQKLESLTVDLFRQARLPLDQAAWQAGVDLGTAVRARDDAVRKGRSRAREKNRPNGKMARSNRSRRRERDSIQVEIRPKRRMPISEVLLVGGATRMPAIHRFVENMTGLSLRQTTIDPDLAVAMGAAVQAGIYEGQLSDLMVMDVWQATLMRAYAQQLALEESDLGSEIDGDGGEDEEEEYELLEDLTEGVAAAEVEEEHAESG